MDGPGGRAGDPDGRGARRQRAGGGRQGSPTTTGRGGRGELSDDGEPDDDWPGGPTGGGRKRWRKERGARHQRAEAGRSPSKTGQAGEPAGEGPGDPGPCPPCKPR